MDCPTGKVVHTLQTAKAASKLARRRTEKTLAPTAATFVASGMWGRTAGSKSQQRPSETTTK